MKTSKNSKTSKSFYLFLFHQLQAGQRPSHIARDSGVSKQALNYYLSRLKQSGFIKKIGYGVWEILKEFEQKEVKIKTGLGINDWQTSKSDSVRGHGFQIKLKLPSNLRNWTHRQEILTKQGIAFKQLDFLISQAQALEFKGKKIWLTDSSIIIFDPKSYFTATSHEAKTRALFELIQYIEALESFLKANFKINKQYVFKVSQQHYALVKNALAKQYDSEGKKLSCYTEKGLWFMIDNSFNLHEAETLHPETADLDNKKVQDFFNGIKKYEGFTPEFVLNSLGGLTTNLEYHSENLRSHVEAIQKLGTSVEQLVQQVKRLGKAKDL